MNDETKVETTGGEVAAPKPREMKHPVAVAALLVFIVLSAVFWQCYDSRYVHFSNDGPLGEVVAERSTMPLLWEGHLPTLMAGLWDDLVWIGYEAVPAAPSVTTALRWLAWDHIAFSRFLALASLFLVGLCASYCLRKTKLAPVACILGGLAAALNSDFLSTSCWGVAEQTIGFAATYVAIGLLSAESPRRKWIGAILAGLAVGLGIMEAYDIGAMFSLLVAAFVAYRAIFVRGRVPPAKNIVPGIARLALVTIFAAFIAAQTLNALIGTQVQGVVGMQQDEQTKRARWAEATQWSLPKVELLQVIVPGVFGYRMAGVEGANYWGTIGASPLLPEAERIMNDPAASPQVKIQMKALLTNPGSWRFSGTGYYAGVTVVLIALWAVLQSFRRNSSPFSPNQRRMIWFWLAVMAISIPLAFGKFAPFYQFFYALPYASTVRNPTKFMHVFNFALIIVFAYGAHGIFVAYMRKNETLAPGIFAQFKAWLVRASVFERRWIIGCAWTVGAAVMAWLFYSYAAGSLKTYILTTGIPAQIAAANVTFSIHAIGWFVLFLALGVVLLAMIFSGQFSGSRARYGLVLLGALIVLDLCQSDRYWPLYWKIDYKYASNPVIDLLRDKPYEHRVDYLPWGRESRELSFFKQLYDIEWHQQLFPYYNIQSLGMVMESRVPEDKSRFMQALPPPPTSPPPIQLRTWELTSGRYLLGNGGENFVNALNKQLDPVQQRFRVATFPDGRPATFKLTGKPGTSETSLNLVDLTAVPDPNGTLGVVEFTGALPRASLFSNWKIAASDDAVLNTLPSPDFDPHKLVYVSNHDCPVPTDANTNLSPGIVEIKNYHSRRIELSADAKTPSVLLLTDRFDPKWHVEVDGKPAEVLRCDYILRGVYLTPGKHDVVFKFVVPLTSLYVSLCAIAIGLILCVRYAFTPGDPKDSAEQTTLS